MRAGWGNKPGYAVTREEERRNEGRGEKGGRVGSGGWEREVEDLRGEWERSRNRLSSGW